MYCARTARQTTPPECHETIAQTTDSALYSTCRACATGQRLMATVSWAKEGGADATPIYNDTEETMTMTIREAIEAYQEDTLQADSPSTTPKKAAKKATAVAPTPAARAQTPTAASPAQTSAPAEAKTYTIIDVCERTQLPYGTVYAAIRHLQRGKPATSPSQKTVKEALKTMRIGAADLVTAKGKGPKAAKRGGDSPLDELAAAQALAAAVAPAPAPEESKGPAVPFPSPFPMATVPASAPATKNDVQSAAPQPDEGDPGALDQAVDEVAPLTTMPSPAPLRIQNQPVFSDDELFQALIQGEITEQAVISDLSTLQRTPWGHAMYDARGDLNVSLHELSDMVGVTPSRLSEAEYGLEVLTPEERSLVEEALCMTFSRVVPLSLETFPLEALLTELQRRFPHDTVINFRIGPAAAA